MREISRTCSLSFFWYLANGNNFGNPNRPKTGKVQSILIPDIQKKVMSFYTV